MNGLETLGSGQLDKMRIDAPLAGGVAQANYSMILGDQVVPMAPLIGQQVELHRSGDILCSHCGRATRKSYSQGFCFPCMRKLAACDLCVMSPERCHYAEGTCREPAWGEKFCMQGHLVYLANSSGLKVGLTKPSQVPTRWLDQGASQAVLICRTSTRQVAGFVEDALRGVGLADRTRWQQLVQGEPELLDLAAARDQALADAAPALAELEQRFGPGSVLPLADEEPIRIEYPVHAYPDRAKAVNLDKTDSIGGRLLGIKGQYLLFDEGVFNVRRHTSYGVSLLAGPAPEPASEPIQVGLL